MNPETGEPVSTWYNPGQTWDTVFSSIASTYEECRAECVGVYLCVHPQVLEIFGHTDDGDDIVYANWLSMAYAGLRSLMYVIVSLLAAMAGGGRCLTSFPHLTHLRRRQCVQPGVRQVGPGAHASPLRHLECDDRSWCRGVGRRVCRRRCSCCQGQGAQGSWRYDGGYGDGCADQGAPRQNPHRWRRRRRRILAQAAGVQGER